MASALHDRERAFFDRRALTAPIEYLDPRILVRYAQPGTLFPREFSFRLLEDLRGKTVLDVGCGEGIDAVVLSKLGACVTGVDLSGGAISVARQRCAANRTVADFFVRPVETLWPEEAYDIVWVEALLHHVLHDLDNVMRRLMACVRPGGLIVMAEPVNLCASLRRLRLRIGTPDATLDATPDERPLEQSDIATIRRHVPGMQTRYFRAVGRLDAWIYDQQYERAAWPVRAAVRSLAIADRALLAVPGAHRLASVAVMWGRRWPD